MEIAGIDEVHGIHFPGGLTDIGTCQRHKGVFLVAGFSPLGEGSLSAVAQLPVLHPALSGPASMEGKHGKICIIHIQAGGQYLGQIDYIFLSTQIGHPDTSCYHI